MPTYDYECQACEKTFEIFHSMSEDVKRKCPECGKLKLRRLPGGGGGLLFKGSGFYITDYRSDDYKAKAKAETDSSKSTSADGDKKTGEKKDGGAAASSGGETKAAKPVEKSSK